MTFRSTFPKVVIAIFIFIALFSVFTLPTFAQDAIFKSAQCTGVNCGFCNLLALFQGIIRFLILISIPIASLLFAYAGFLYFSSAGDSGKLEKAKQIFIDVAIGFILALSAWLIVETILRTTLRSDYFGTSSWNTIQCIDNAGRLGVTASNSFSQGTNPNTSITIGTNAPPATGPQGEVDTRTPDQKALAEAATRELLARSDITVNKGPCGVNVSYAVTPGGCTDVSLLTQDTIDYVKQLAVDCKCSIVITGGSELGHQTHADGRRLDLAMSSDLTSYVTLNINNGHLVPIPGKTNYYRSPQGTCFFNEGDHWHVDVKSC